MKNSLIVLIFCLLSTSLLAQIQLNPKTGWNKFKFKPSEESLLTSSKERGFQIGADIRMGSANYVQTGVHFVASNARYVDGRVDLLEPVDKTRLEMVKVPLSIGRTFLDLEVLQIHLRLGGVANFPLAVEEVNVNFVDIEDYETFNFGAIGALGLEVFRVTFDIQFEHALTDIFANDAGSKNHLWSFSLGYLF